MNALILGKNTVNAEIKKRMADEGVDAAIIEDAAKIIKFKGGPGDYTVTAREGESGYSAVIVTEPPLFSAPEAGGGAVINLMDDVATAALDDLRTKEKIVILLDYMEETREYVATKAIGIAMRLAERKKEVVFLSKVVKTGYGDNEQRYNEARRAGVAFIKYETVSLAYDDETDRFKVSASDGVFLLNIDTPFVISTVSAESAGLVEISKKLRLYKRPDAMINDDRFFMYPVFSTRRGVYYLNPGIVMPGYDECVKTALPMIIKDMAAIGKDGYQDEIVRNWQFPEVDPGKCAFCYSCYRACPHGALEPDMSASAMKVNEAACRSCGICAAICPGDAISRKGDAKQQAGRGKCKIYCCENGAASAFEEILPSLGAYGQLIDSERVACGGNVGADMLARDFKDYKTVIIACCIEDACRHMDGDKRACKQAGRAEGLLQKAGLSNKRVRVIKASHAMRNVMKDNILSELEGYN